jgi:hypothetical protein
MLDAGDEGKKVCGHLYSFVFPGGNFGAGGAQYAAGGNGSLLHSSLCLLSLGLIIQAVGVYLSNLPWVRIRLPIKCNINVLCTVFIFFYYGHFSLLCRNE